MYLLRPFLSLATSTSLNWTCIYLHEEELEAPSLVDLTQLTAVNPNKEGIFVSK